MRRGPRHETPADLDEPPLTLDLGYRYKKVVASDSLQAALAGGGDIDVSQARIGIGIRF